MLCAKCRAAFTQAAAEAMQNALPTQALDHTSFAL
jgi:hypothetical protein